MKKNLRTVCRREPSREGRRFERRACGDRARAARRREPPLRAYLPRCWIERGARAWARRRARRRSRASRRGAHARLRGAGDAARAGGHHAFNELGFFRERACVSSRGARRRKERRAGTRTRHEAGPSRGDETRAWRRASKCPSRGERLARYRRRFRWDRCGGAFLKTGGQIFRTAVPSKIYRVSRIVRLVPKASCDIFSARGAECERSKELPDVIIEESCSFLLRHLVTISSSSRSRALKQTNDARNERRSHARDVVVALRDVPHPPVRPVVRAAPRSSLPLAAVDLQIPNLQSRRVERRDGER